MFGRPRCREYTPLATQQLRLRSLIQIVGYNIRPPEGCMYQCSFYLTLHHTTMSAPFYTSERICSPHPKWKEIDSEITHRISSTNVVIRIWCHTLHPSKESDDSCDRPQDQVIQTWGVYFTGLRYLGANLASNFTSDCFKSNTLVFQMHGGYFCSYKSLKLDIIPPENEMEHSSPSSDSSGKTNLSKVTLESKFIQNHRFVKESRSISPSRYARRTDKEYSKSQSPIERGFRQQFPTIKNSASLNMAQPNYRGDDRRSNERKLDPNHIYEHSPNHSDVKEFTTSDLNCDNLSNNASREELAGSKIDLSETAENYDLRNESDGVPKYRYYAMSFLKSEIRPSYNSEKLQKLHILQYSIKKRQEAVQEIKEKIYKNSALTCRLTQSDEFGNVVRLKGRSQRNLFSLDDDCPTERCSSQGDLSPKNGRVKDDRPVANGPRLALKLNDLLSFKAKPSPFQRAEHVRLTKQIEILRFKRKLLADERDSKMASIRRLKEKHAKLCEENQDLGLELMQKWYSLSRRSELLRERRQSCAALRELAARAHRALAEHRGLMLRQLAGLFRVEQVGSSWSICGVPLAACADGAARACAGDAAAAGYAAQTACLAASALGLPLRYRVALRGSASTILDVTADLPDPNIPLFPRGGDATLFRYGMFLLNKCIAQLLWARGLPVADMRPTLANLHRLLTAPHNPGDTSKLFGTYRWMCESRCPHTQSLRSLVASDRGKYRQFNRFKDSIDGRSPQAATLSRHRHSRSVGSYNDDQELPSLDQSTTSIMGSEPNIYNSMLSHASSADLPQSSMKTHNSDSEIQWLTKDQADTDEGKVVFTLGDDTCLADLRPEMLVKISTNNEDMVENDHSVKDDKDEEGFDVVKHLEAISVSIDIAKYMEGKRNSVVECNSCADECEVSCANVSDVIVIPSAEAVLNTGQEAVLNTGQEAGNVDNVEQIQ